jgi:hypothetical protein
MDTFNVTLEDDDGRVIAPPPNVGTAFAMRHVPQRGDEIQLEGTCYTVIDVVHHLDYHTPASISLRIRAKSLELDWQMRRVATEELITGIGLLALSAVGYGMSHAHGFFWSFLALVGVAALFWSFYFRFRRWYREDLLGDTANRWPLRCVASDYENPSIAIYARSRQRWLIFCLVTNMPTVSEFKIGRRIVRPIVVFVLFAVFVTLAPILNIPLPFTRVVSVVFLALVIITPFLPTSGRWEVRVYFGLLALLLVAVVSAVLWARFW